MKESHDQKNAHLKSDPSDEKSIELLEKSIQENSPEFLKEIESIEKVGDENLSIELEDLEHLLELERAKSLKARFRKGMHWLRGFLIHSFYFFKAQLLRFLKEGIPVIIVKIKSGATTGSNILGQKIKKLKALNRIQKIALVILIGGFAGLSFVFIKIIGPGLIKEDNKPFIFSMDEFAIKKSYYELGEMEDFYNSPRASRNLVSIKRIVVNIKRSESSGPLPMLAVEFFVQGNASEVMVEIRDREPEIVDAIGSEIKEFSYDDLDSVEGKKRLLSKLVVELNTILIKGKITAVYFKNFVLKR